MIKENYIKEAIIKPNIEIERAGVDKWGEPQSIPLSLSFEPKRIFCELNLSPGSTWFCLDSTLMKSESEAFMSGNTRFYIKSFNKDFIEICRYHNSGTYYLKEIIAIG